MFGLTYIRKLYNLSMDDLAKSLNVSKQTISKWENHKISISSKRIEQLKKIFNLNDDYFSMELKQSEMIHLQLIKAIKESEMINKESDKYDDKVDEVEYLFHLEYETMLIESMKEKIKESYIHDEDIALKLYLEFHDIVNDNSDNVQMNRMIRAFFKAVKILYNKEDVFSSDTKTRYKENYDKSLVNKLVTLLSKYKIDKK